MALGRFFQLMAFIMLCVFAGLFGSFVNYTALDTWYPTLVKPSFTPPPALFGIVWTALYILMGISAYLVFRQAGKKKGIRNALYVFGIQLVLNALWSVLFFGLRSPLLGLIEIIVLLFAIAFTIHKFYPISRAAAWLLAPYLLWAGFAAVLNYYFWILN